MKRPRISGPSHVCRMHWRRSLESARRMERRLERRPGLSDFCGMVSACCGDSRSTWHAYRHIKADWAVQRRRASPRRRKGRHIDIAADIFSESARLPRPQAQALIALAAVLAKGAVEGRKRLRHGESIITRAIRVYAK
jgi:hypothetical protein